MDHPIEAKPRLASLLADEILERPDTRTAGERAPHDSTTPRVSVLIIDSHPTRLIGAALAVHAAPNLNLLGFSTARARALRLIRQYRPTVTTIELTDPAEVRAMTSALRDEQHSTVILLRIDRPTSPQLADCLEAGAVGVISSRASPNTITAAITLAAHAANTTQGFHPRH